MFKLGKAYSSSAITDFILRSTIQRYALSLKARFMELVRVMITYLLEYTADRLSSSSIAIEVELTLTTTVPNAVALIISDSITKESCFNKRTDPNSWERQTWQL